ncbi:MAG: gfo/Idh/MocA family oxidoreductase, partial [Verrucomicrobiota bacterium]
TLLVKHLDKAQEVYRTGNGYLGAAAAANSRTPAAHPEGYLEAFANIYRNFAGHIRARLSGTEADATTLDYPKIEDGVRGMAFIEAVVASSKHNASWTKIETGH